MKLGSIGLALLVSVVAGSAQGAEPLRKLAGKLAHELKGRENKKVAVLDFTYPGGARSSGSSIVQERLTTFLVDEAKVEVIERSRLNAVLDELKLQETGLLDESSTRKVGKVLGVGAVVAGTLNDLGKDKTEVNARVIDTETGKILAAGVARFDRTWTDDPVRPGQTAAVKPGGAGAFLGKPLIQLAILLDTSNSMDGLIAQAKTQLWKIVNHLASAERGGNNPVVTVALYEYGNDTLSAESGYVRQVLPFTADLDKVSEKLFELKTRGGQEYCGWVMKDAVKDLAWDSHADVYKAVFIAGNEPFTQGPVDFRESAAAAAAKGIFVNTVFCGNRQEGVATQWKAGADLAGGEYMNIDQETRVAAVAAPQDAEIEHLGRSLNDTFVPMGREGREANVRQEAQDKNAMAYSGSGAMVQRQMFKSKSQYSASMQGDAVNEVVSGRMEAKGLKKDELPESLRSLSAEELDKHLRKKAEEREGIRRRIEALSVERSRYITQQETLNAGKPGANTLDAAVLDAVKGQASKKNLTFK